MRNEAYLKQLEDTNRRFVLDEGDAAYLIAELRRLQHLMTVIRNHCQSAGGRHTYPESAILEVVEEALDGTESPAR